MSHTREQHREMILNPDKWPLLYLPLKRPGLECAFMTAPLSQHSIPEDQPIEIRIGTIFNVPLQALPRKTYTDVDALLDDGWMVD